jgi:hypothetical protein
LRNTSAANDQPSSALKKLSGALRNTCEGHKEVLQIHHQGQTFSGALSSCMPQVQNAGLQKQIRAMRKDHPFGLTPPLLNLRNWHSTSQPRSSTTIGTATVVPQWRSMINYSHSILCSVRAARIQADADAALLKLMP